MRGLHDATAQKIDGIKVSVGLVRMTRIAHTAALAVQLPAGPRDGRMRLKLCLHSQFPRFHRAWIERELKRALTRKGQDPLADLRSLCERRGLIRRVREHGCNQLEIVVVTSPVIETGNDLDFDWAILDPSSMRAVVQAAGRVWRHRRYQGDKPNVAILGRSPIVMQTGKLARPGVETSLHMDTQVARVCLDEFNERLFTELVGETTFDQIDSRAILGEGNVPLREKEEELRRRMIDTTGAAAPLGSYIRHSTTRLNRRMTLSRMFRRNTTRDLLYFQDGQDWHTARWYVDLAPGTRNCEPRVAESSGLCVTDACGRHLLFPSLNRLAWEDYLRGEKAQTASELRRLTQVQVPDYADPAKVPEPIMTYCEWTGFTRGTPGDLLEPFGKNPANQYDA
jgi:CRISPR-associated endonuclease/helicase Cas3